MMMIQEKHKTEAQHNNIQNNVYKLFILNKRNYNPGISYNVSTGILLFTFSLMCSVTSAFADGVQAVSILRHLDNYRLFFEKVSLFYYNTVNKGELNLTYQIL
jgi:hypothetical protein